MTCRAAPIALAATTQPTSATPPRARARHGPDRRQAAAVTAVADAANPTYEKGMRTRGTDAPTNG